MKNRNLEVRVVKAARRRPTWLLVAALACLSMVPVLSVGSVGAESPRLVVDSDNLVRAVRLSHSNGSYSSVPVASWRVNGVGRAVLKVGNTVYVGGSFSRATSPSGSESAQRSNLAAFDARTGALISAFDPDVDGTVRSLTTDGASLFIGGSFATVGGVSRSGVAALDLSSGSVLPAFVADANLSVYALSLGGGRLYLAGTFSSVNGSTRERVAAVSPETGQLDPTFRADVSGSVYAVAATADGSKVYIGGSYSGVNGASANTISTLDGSTGAIVGPHPIDNSGTVEDLTFAPDGRSLIAARAGSDNEIAVYDIATGTNTWSQEVGGDVQAVHAIGDSVFGGFHDSANGDGASRLAQYDLNTGAENTSFHPTFNRFLGTRAIHGDRTAVVIAGDFSNVSGVRVEGFAIFPTAPATQFAATIWGSEKWRYLDNGSDQGDAWREPGFNDSTWKSGQGEFGYSGGDVRTQISSGPSSTNGFITSYFRKTFEASSTPSSAAIYIRVDDGAVVYVNGVEAARDNISPGPVGHTTLAANRDGDAEGSSRYFRIEPSLIRAGTNTIAVEIHQSSAQSTDMKFFATVVAFR